MNQTIQIKKAANIAAFFILTILAVGLSGIVAQVLLLRELLVSFYGNELTIGLVLANWVALEALGVFIAGKYIDRVKNKINIFIALEIVFLLFLPVSVYLSRTYKAILGVLPGEAPGLPLIFFASFLIILPLGFCHGALFSVGSRIYPIFCQKNFSEQHKGLAATIGKVYAWENLGTIIGGIVLTYFFIPYLNSFQIVFVICLVNLIICFFLLQILSKTKVEPRGLKAEAPSRAECNIHSSLGLKPWDFREGLKYAVLAGIVLLVYLALSGNLNYIQGISLKKEWGKGAQVLDYRNSIYGNIAVTRESGQDTFFYNGIPIITTPYPDIIFVEEFGHLPLLFHQAPQDILIVSAGAGGLINEILKHPIKKIDYVELDPLIIDMLKKYPSELTKAELSDKRVNLINTDGRFFLRSTANQYDIVLVGLSKPSDLSTNRLFTQEFFSLVKKRLRPDGILALWLPGSLTYLSRELRDLNICILNGLKQVYNYVRIIPGDYNIFLASSSGGITEVSGRLISQKIREQNIKTNVLIPGYLDYRLNKKWVDWFMGAISSGGREVNHDLKPQAAFAMLKFLNRQFSPKTANILEFFQRLDLRMVSVFVFLVSIILFYIFYRARKFELSLAYNIFTTGFFGMLANLILIFAYQVYYGYLYHRIGLLISIFMAGIVAASIFMTGRLQKLKNTLNLFAGLEVMIILFSFIMPFILTRLTNLLHYASLVFSVLFFITGFLIGLEFPLASKMYLGDKRGVGETVGILYSADLIGGWLAGILGGIVFLPVLGLFNTCLVIIMFKLSSLFLLLAAKRWFI